MVDGLRLASSAAGAAERPDVWQEPPERAAGNDLCVDRPAGYMTREGVATTWDDVSE